MLQRAVFRITRLLLQNRADFFFNLLSQKLLHFLLWFLLQSVLIVFSSWGRWARWREEQWEVGSMGRKGKGMRVHEKGLYMGMMVWLLYTVVCVTVVLQPRFLATSRFHHEPWTGTVLFDWRYIRSVIHYCRRKHYKKGLWKTNAQLWQ